MIDFDVVIVGGGVVGLACGLALSKQGLSLVILEGQSQIATITSARNSEVIHAGLYYPKNSLKHLLCLRGRQLLYEFSAQHHIDYKKCGKVVVATNRDELAQIEILANRAIDNGVENVYLLSNTQLRELEPQVAAVGGLLSAETGIVDAHGFCQSLARMIEENGGIIALNTPFLGAQVKNYGFDIAIGGNDPVTLRTRYLINGAGLAASHVARRIQGLNPQFCRQLVYAKGSYFSLNGKSPFSRLVYPAPVEGGLGVHATLDLAGRVRFGPDVEWLSVEDETPEFDYRVDGSRLTDFYTSIRRYWPQLKKASLLPDYAGIRPKLSGRGQTSADFALDDAAYHGIDGLINLFGIESPGLTASLAIGEEVAIRLKT